jgi:hypothetical protein
MSAAGEGETGLASTGSLVVGAAVDPPVFLRFAWALEGAGDGYTYVKDIENIQCRVIYALRVDLHWRQL